MDSASDISPLSRLIRDEIIRSGPVSFAWFMGQALYHPVYGYYCTSRKRIGRAGDFITNVSVGNLFGQIIAEQITEMRETLGRPRNFTVVEQGAEDGQLASDILEANEKSGQAPFEYVIIEPINSKRSEQRSNLGRFTPNSVRWLSSIGELKPVTGVFLANELLDAMPVHLVEYRDLHWHELLIDWWPEGFRFWRSRTLPGALAEALRKLPAPRCEPYRTEVNLNAPEWVEQIASRLQNGFVLLIDYGYSREEYYKPERTEGTLSCYSRHRRYFNPLENPGQMDITAHVDFTSVAESAARAGLSVAGFTDQHHFMVGATESALPGGEAAFDSGAEQRRFLRQLKTLMHPANMGMAFKYLLLSTSDQCGLLSGFKYGREPGRDLGL